MVFPICFLFVFNLRIKPGRVATLIPAASSEARVWGCVYEVLGEQDVQLALNRLIEREVVNGGYRFDRVRFYPVQSPTNKVGSRDKVKNWIPPEQTNTPSVLEEPFEVLFHLTDTEVDLYLGETSMEAQADQIVSAYGISGANSEYVLLMAAFLRTEVPNYIMTEGYDPYLFELEALVRQRLAQPIRMDLPTLKVSTESDSKETMPRYDGEVHQRRRLSAREFAEIHFLSKPSSQISGM
ncbi:unnamed protein product [Echinostoma caproni]|uniref:Gamma-glutamylcyclotransferase n=1 Tax=Echinostoma caproni TaxID=27848 RepID=A0A183A9J4_9TREM|nr:unnamed protein product [Echinostoma caproni]